MAAGISSIMAQGGMDLARRPVPNLLCQPGWGLEHSCSPSKSTAAIFQAAQQLLMLAVISQLGQMLQAIPQVPWSRAFPREMQGRMRTRSLQEDVLQLEPGNEKIIHLQQLIRHPGGFYFITVELAEADLLIKGAAEQLK